MKLPIGSYSFYNAFENCPFKAFHIYVARTLPYVESPEMAWGNKVHAAMEARIRDGVPLPEEMQAAERIAGQFRSYHLPGIPVQVEWQLAMTARGEPCEWKSSDAWFRGKLDCVVYIRPNAWLVDWKTGNVREDPFELECGAMLLKAHDRALEMIRGEYFWMKTGQAGIRYTLNDHRGTYAKIMNLRTETETYLAEGTWPKRKTPLCGYCPVKACENCYDARAGETAPRRK